MPKDRLWQAAATIEVDGISAGPYRLDHSGAVTIGRSMRAGRHSPAPRIEVPRELARLRCTRSGWVLENEGTTVGRPPKSVRITGPDIQSRNGALFAPEAWVLLGKGEWTLKWDVGVTVTVVLKPLAEAGEIVGDALDQPRRFGGNATLAPERVNLTELERRNMAALFAYLIRGEPEPRESYAEAARLLGGAPGQRAKTRDLVRAQLPKVAKRINRRRAKDNALVLFDDIGRYLVDVTGTLGRDDLED